jgi:hypothetical protein
MDIRTRLKKLEQTMTEQKTTREWEEACTCFPPDELPAFHWLAEVEIAAAVRCPLHGVRFHAIETPPFIYRSKWLRRTDHMTFDCSGHSPQYSKAWRAGFPPDLWPARVSFQCQSGPTETLILRDGTEIASGGSAKKWQPAKLEDGR